MVSPNQASYIKLHIQGLLGISWNFLLKPQFSMVQLAKKTKFAERKNGSQLITAPDLYLDHVGELHELL